MHSLAYTVIVNETLYRSGFPLSAQIVHHMVCTVAWKTLIFIRRRDCSNTENTTTWSYSSAEKNGKSFLRSRETCQVVFLKPKLTVINRVLVMR